MKLVLGLTLAVLALMLGGCERQQPQVPVSFDVTGVAAALDASNTNAMKITGTVRTRSDALRDKTVLLRISGRVLFKASGITQPFFAHGDQVLITNGTGMLELWFFVTPAEKKAIDAELTTPSYIFKSEGYAELKPAAVEVR